MPKITLRDYIREISGLIDRGQTDEAIAHCQYILQSYPKHLESYRLLGKSFLEAHRYEEAKDIFQRVLAVAPDDFVTHIGMSIIHGEENNLDGAIWHMERAFEVQPSNQAIQDELKQLYGRRDGIVPPKIRLTRGALSRMYARGNQYRQAIAEIKAVQLETPDRADLDVLLARMYYQSGMTGDALDLCRRLLEKMPFCNEANKLMVQILRDANKTADADFYQKKLIAMDPYEGYLTDPTSSAETVADDAITIEKFFYDSSGQPETAAGKAAVKDSDGDEAAPDWLISDLAGDDDLGSKGFTRILDSSTIPSEAIEEQATASTQPVVVDAKIEDLPGWLQGSEKQPSPVQEENIPDFLKATGWAAAGTIDEQAPVAQVINVDEPPADGKIAPGEIPDWLQTIAPEEKPEETPTPAPVVDDKFQDWLTNMEAEPQPKAEPEAPEVMDTVEQPAFTIPSAEPATEIPDWMKDIPGAPVGEVQPVEEVPEEPSPDWMAEVVPHGTASLNPDDVAQGGLVVDDAFPVAGGTSILSPDDVPDWLQDLQPNPGSTPPDSPAFASTAALNPVESLEHLPPDEVVTMTLTGEEKEAMPEWLAEMQQANIPAEPVVDERQTANLPEDEKDEEPMPDWLHLLDQDSPQPVLPDETNEDLDFTLTQPVESTAIPFGETILPVIAADEEIAQVEPVVQTEGTETPVDEETPTTSILPPNPEDRKEEVPEWLRDIDQPESVLPEPVAEPVLEEVEEKVDEPAFPDWLKGYSAPVVEPALPPAEPMDEAAVSDEIPGWLQDMNVVNEENEPQLPDWLKEMQITTEEPAAEEAQTETEEAATLPVWLKAQAENNETGGLPFIEPRPVEAEQTLEVVGEAEEIVSEVEPIVEEEPLSEAPVAEILTPESLLSTALPTIESAVADQVFDAEPEVEPVAEIPAVQEEPVEMVEEVPAIETPEAEIEGPVAVEEIEEVPEPVSETTEEPAEVDVEAPISVSVFEEAVGFVPEAITEVETEPEIPEPLPVVEPEPTPVFETEAEATHEDIAPVSEPIVKKAAKPSAQKAPSTRKFDYTKVLEEGMNSLENGDLETGLVALSKLVKAEKHLDKVIEVVTKSLEKNPTDTPLWITLGDACGRSGKLQDALDAYTRAEEYLQ